MKFRLILVPEDGLIARSPKNAVPEYVTVRPDALCELIADVEDHKIIMSRAVYDQVEVADPVKPPFPGDKDVVV